MAESPIPAPTTSPLERLLLGLAGLAFLISIALSLLEARPAGDRDRLVDEARIGYGELWQEIDRVLDGAAATLGRVDLETAGVLSLFDQARRALPEPSETDWSAYLLDPTGRLRAWSGAGLLHPLDPETLPGAGRAFRASVTAVTLLAVAEVPEWSGWRTVVGTSLPTDQLPYPLPRRAHLGTHWGLAPIGDTGPGGRTAILLPETPTLMIGGEDLGVGPVDQERPWFASPLVWLGVWLLLAASTLRRRLGWLAALLAALAVSLWGIAAHSPLAPLLGLATLGALISADRATSRRHVPMAIFRGVIGVVGLLGVAALLQLNEVTDLADHFVVEGPVWVPRALLFLLSFAWVCWIVRLDNDSESATGSQLIWIGSLSVASAAATVDWPFLAGLLLLAGGGLLGLALSRLAVRKRPLIAGGLVFLAALTAATANEIAYRAALRESLDGPVLAALAPPTSTETVEIGGELAEYFDELDLGWLAGGDVRKLDRSDLAFELWRRSPLARGRAVSAVALRGDDGEQLLFSFGIPIDNNGRPRIRSRERPFDNPVWDYTLINEVTPVTLDDEPWGVAEYWLLVRPGFRLAEPHLADVTEDLLRGGPSGRGAVQDLLEPAAYAHYVNARRARISPWLETPALPPAIFDNGKGEVETPDGRSWVWTAAEADGTRALFLPRLAASASLVRVGTHALGDLLPLGVLMVAALLLRLSRPDFRRRAGEIWRSYSRRLVLVFSLLVVVPAVVVDVLVLRVLREQIEEKEFAEARGALASAQRVLGEYAGDQRSGISLDTIFDDELLSWLAEVLDHDINLYWAGTSQVAASSRQELFAAGLLPKRMPGEVYASLRLRGQRLATRLHRRGGTEYTELYAPLVLPGQEPQSADFFLSIPLIAQQAEMAEEAESLRHTVVLGTTLLVLLLVSLGARLAAGFTSPIEELVVGTQRIAEGAEHLGLEPREQELARLVGAINRMAERIADGRRKLVLEKQVVERMVDNITAAVVSIDAEHRVLMQNGVAGSLLGTEVGARLEDSLGEEGNLGRVLEGLERSRERREPETVSLPVEDDEGETRQWSLVWVPIPGEGEPKALVVVEDVTAVVRSQRLQAWAEMARIIAHEIKNPLTPIRLSAEHLRGVRHRDPESFDRIFDQCIANILTHVEELRTISTEFSTYARIPRIDPEEGSLTRCVRDLVTGYQMAPPSGVTIALQTPETDLALSFDQALLTRALRNLLENAVRAVADGGSVEVTLEAEGDQAVLVVADDGPGVDGVLLAKIFDPYFSTHDTGTGLGLPIARRIIEEHGGEIRARNRSDGGLAVRVTLPIERSRGLPEADEESE